MSAEKRDQGKIDLTYVPPELMALLSDPFAAGAIKYAREGWRGRFGFRLIQAGYRHFAKVLNNQTFDEETGCREKVQAAWNLLMSAREDIYETAGCDLAEVMDFDEFCGYLNDPDRREEFIRAQEGSRGQ
ncbi:MAG: hypothetical protein GY906_23030 [bacterium]|nr:hypothetical protein [bacterium]